MTSIEWTDKSINPLRAGVGDARGHYCEKVSLGCKNCYSSRMQRRFRMPQFQEQRSMDVDTFLDVGRLMQVVRRRTPTKWFWCDMTDIFGGWVPFDDIAACFAAMAATPWHTHQVLTKRAKRMRDWFDKRSNNGLRAFDWALEHPSICGDFGNRHAWTWPLPNVHLGVSCENQAAADERIPHLLATPASVRFVSAEPLLGPVALARFLSPCEHPSWAGDEGPVAQLGRWPQRWRCDGCGVVQLAPEHETAATTPGIDWVIAGSESGPGARPIRIEWIESLRDQCRDAGTAFFTKQIASARDRKGGNPEHWPPGDWPREFPTNKETR